LTLIYPLFGLEYCGQSVDMLIGLISGKSDMEFMDDTAIAGLVLQLKAIRDGISDVHDIVHAQLPFAGFARDSIRADSARQSPQMGLSDSGRPTWRADGISLHIPSATCL
jgi:hypothetical protein